jgi:hypothetical protein
MGRHARANKQAITERKTLGTAEAEPAIAPISVQMRLEAWEVA